jgi:Zn-dependent oligopeptidase
MEIEYSNEVKGKVHAYRFDDVEKQHISDALNSVVNNIERKIYKVLNHPKNEGQATYAVKVDELRREQRALEYIIEVFNNDLNKKR